MRLPATEVIEVPAGDEAEALARLARDPDVRYAEADRPLRALAPDLSGSQWALDRIGARSVWNATRGENVIVAVVDTGVDPSHEDLPPERIAPGGRDYVDRDFMPLDRNGHGTHVAATVAGDLDAPVNMGVVGVAPGARILPLRALDGDGGGSPSDVSDAFVDAGRAGAKIVTASLGGFFGSRALDDAMRANPQTLYVAAAGNEDADNDRTPVFPCNSAAPNVICVGATTMSDGVASFSNVGRATVDVFAPGTDILSAWILPQTFLAGDGTSFAAPQVSGVAALVAARFPALTATGIKNQILAGADPLPSLAGRSVTGGRLNAPAALTAVAADRDADGIGDAWDVCGDAPDPAQADADLDGLGDACEDGDADGVPDAADRCPSFASPQSTNGCPETVDGDRDGLPDATDRCPTLPGLGSPDGCPAPAGADRDGDGRPDAADRCPDEPGTADNGCALASLLRVSARSSRCARRVRCLRVSVRTDRLGAVSVTAQRRRCTRGSCRWVSVLRRTVSPRRTSATIALKGGRSHRLTRGRYRLRVSVRTAAGSSPAVLRTVTVR